MYSMLRAVVSTPFFVA